jgi:hypothetical protein
MQSKMLMWKLRTVGKAALRIATSRLLAVTPDRAEQVTATVTSLALRGEDTEGSRGMHREKLIILAGKYVLGHLSEQDAADVEGRMETDPAFRRIVSQWRDRLADLEGVTEPIEPSSDLWGRIVRKLKMSSKGPA